MAEEKSDPGNSLAEELWQKAEEEEGERLAKRLAEDPKTKEVLDEWISVVSDVFEIPEYGNIKVISGDFDGDESGIFPYVKLLIYILTKQEEECVCFGIKKNFDPTGFSIINVHAIEKCNMGGNNILKAIEDVAQKLEIKYVIIGEDASHINLKHYRYSLYLLSILSTGESWYNRRGYKQIPPPIHRVDDEELELDNTSLYDEETAANTKFITETKVLDFLKSKTSDIDFIGLMNSIVPFKDEPVEDEPVKDKTVQDYFKEIDDGLRNDRFVPFQQELIDELLDYFSYKNPHIKYTGFNLVKKINDQGNMRPSHVWDEEGPPSLSRSYSISLAYPNKTHDNVRLTRSLSDTRIGRIAPSKEEVDKWRSEIGRGGKRKVSRRKRSATTKKRKHNRKNRKTKRKRHSKLN